MRVLWLLPEYEGRGGGIATFYRNLAGALRDAGADLKIIEGSALHAGERGRRTVDGVPIETLERDRLTRWWDRFAAFAAVPGLRRHLAAAWAMWEQAEFAADADVVEAADWGLLFVPPLVEGVRPLVIQGHGSIGQVSAHDPLQGEEIQGAMTRLIEAALIRAGAESADVQPGERRFLARRDRPRSAGDPPRGSAWWAPDGRGCLRKRSRRRPGPTMEGSAGCV